MKCSITVVGCGLMGSAIAKALKKNGNALVAYNRSPGPLEALSRLGIPTSTDIDAAIWPAAGSVDTQLSQCVIYLKLRWRTECPIETSG